MSYYNSLPDTISFSPKFVSLLNGSIESAERYVKKECGGDYKKIRVGMTLSRVQKCYGEFFLTGQVQRNGSTVSQYRRGNGHVVGNDFLYVSNGKILAWEKF